MLSAALITVSLILGYVVVIALVMVSTLAIAKLHPHFAVDNHHLRGGYKLFQDLCWCVFAFIGGFVAILAAAEASISLTSVLLATILLIALWRNYVEARQRGLLHMLLASVCIVAGIGAAYAIRAWQIH